ncbi:DUF349 domain-containing protein [Flavobacterium sp.]|jgi:hypothetical protein|uniref:DUF349 domain-containing protein n=1 Tax=Flavobacterium sp. TaxID=239 RepID=UPI0037BFBD6E
MLEELNDNLQQADGQEETTPIENHAPISEENEIESQVLEVTDTETVSQILDEEITGSAQDEIDNHLAEASEDGSIDSDLEIEVKEYESLSLEELVAELATFVGHEKALAYKNQIEDVKKAFLNQFNQLIEEKRIAYYAENETSTEFEYHSPIKVKFDQLLDTFRNKKNTNFKNIENQLKNNLTEKTTLIEELKALIASTDSNISEMFKKFNDIRERWKNSGAIPKDKYNLVWNNFHFHVDRFYEIVHLDREIRDADFKNNLEQKLEIIAKAKLLVEQPDLTKSFRELQLLHRVWKEEIGPVDKENREKIWQEFSEITKILHDKREALSSQFKEKEQENLALKNEIIAEVIALSTEKVNNHGEWQNQIIKLEALRDAFFKAGRVPAEVTELTWSNFKNAVRTFNATKNSFYKDIKNEQHRNLELKLALIEKAKSYIDTEDFDATTPIMKQVQEEWKKIGHVPRKLSDEIWETFKKTCNAYFDRLHDSRKEEIGVEVEAFEKKKEYLEIIRAFALVGDHKTDLDAIKAHIAAWKEFGKVPQNRRHIEGKFNKILDALFEKLSLSKKDAEMMKFSNRLDQLSEGNDQRAIANEQIFMRRKIDELNHEINQLENNIGFFSNAKGNNPFIKEVQNNIEKHKEELQTWKDKLIKLNSI